MGLPTGAVPVDICVYRSDTFETALWCSTPIQPIYRYRYLRKENYDTLLPEYNLSHQGILTGLWKSKETL